MKPEKRKEIIIRAAARSFASHGYHATQISDIIKISKIARGTFYLYFKSKHEIFRYILDDFISHLGSQIKIIELGKGLSPAKQLRKNVERVADAIFTRPEIAKILFNEAVGLDKECQKRLKIFYGRVLGIIASSLRRGAKLGLIRKTDPLTASCAVLGAFKEVLVQNTVFKNTKIGRRKMIDSLIDILLIGLGGRPMLI